MKIRTGLFILAIALLLTTNAGCSRSFVGGAAVGAGGAGAVYEYQNKKALDDLEADLKAGRITQEEYLRRKAEIQKRSVIY
ncbi:hypothetical protein [Geoalkalibacter sp.]|uniref:hypothetical protein n=1 Tax=Geoalkalibacter sp. TaxID=3041440 RepID=UPI00272DD88E|nr:hypothetical protein [Geoalkalibacter sp.]